MTKAKAMYIAWRRKLIAVVQYNDECIKYGQQLTLAILARQLLYIQSRDHALREGKQKVANPHRGTIIYTPGDIARVTGGSINHFKTAHSCHRRQYRQDQQPFFIELGLTSTLVHMHVCMCGRYIQLYT